MTNDRQGQEAIRGLRRLGHAVVPVEDPERVDARRERLVPGLTAFADSVFEAEERGARRRRFVFGGVALAAAAAAAFVLVPRTFRGGAPTPSVLSATGTVLVGRRGAEGTANVAPRALGADDHVRTERGHAEIGLPGGATVTVDPMSELSLANDHAPNGKGDDHVVLGSGTIHVSVPKVASDQRLVVTTPNAVVTGTVFVVQVSAARGGMQTTEVSVTEGRVTVSSGGREIVLEAGASWSSGPAPEIAPSAVALDALPRAETSASPPRAIPPASTLSAENELFRQALLARKNGNAARAVSLLDQLLAKYPGSPLAAEARTERQNAALDADRARGVGSRP